MPPRRRRLPVSLRTFVQLADLAAGEGFRPTMTGAFPGHRSAPNSAITMDSLPDPLSFVQDEDREAPQLGLL